MHLSFAVVHKQPPTVAALKYPTRGVSQDAANVHVSRLCLRMTRHYVINNFVERVINRKPLLVRDDVTFARQAVSRVRNNRSAWTMYFHVA